MSDIYDYAYMGIMDQPSRVKNIVNTEDFTARDLQLFVDSIETITRLEKAKYERKHRSHLESSSIISSLDATMAHTTGNEDVKNSYTTESANIYDEPYYATPYQSQNDVIYSNITTNSLPSFVSDSEESGVFFNNTSDCSSYNHVDIDPVRPRSTVISHPKCKSLKSRLISLIMKRQYVQPAAPIAEILSSTTYGEDMENSDIYDRVLDDVIRQQFAKNPKTCKRRRAISAASSPENTFLIKAMDSINL